MYFILQNYLTVLAILIGILGSFFPARTTLKLPNKIKALTWGDIIAEPVKDYAANVNIKYGFRLILYSFIIQGLASLYATPISIGEFGLILFLIYALIAASIVVLLYFRYDRIIKTKINEANNNIK